MLLVKAELIGLLYNFDMRWNFEAFNRDEVAVGRALLGFVIGLGVMGMMVRVFKVNTFDFENMLNGVQLLIRDVNPWAKGARIDHFYNPPFAKLLLAPITWMPQKAFLTLSGGLVFAWIFYSRAYIAFTWFVTNSLLVSLAFGGIDMYVIGGGLLFLALGDRWFNQWWGLALRIVGYGFLLLKPQGGLLIVAFFILLRKDWKGVLGGLLIWGLPFVHLFPDWLNNIVKYAPPSQTVAVQTIAGKFGLVFGLLIGIWVILARRWQYWQLGGALSAVMMPYGMPGMPLMLIFSAVRSWTIIPLAVIYSAGLALMTWVTPPPGVEYYSYVDPLLAIYHLGMVALALILACHREEGEGEIDVKRWVLDSIKIVRKRAPRDR